MELDLLGAFGLVVGFVGVVATILAGVSQASEARIQMYQLGNYLRDMDGRILHRFDNVEELLGEMSTRIRNLNA